MGRLQSNSPYFNRQEMAFKRTHTSCPIFQGSRLCYCDIDHYLLVAKVREKLAVSKQTMHIFHMERFNLKQMNAVEGKEHYRVKKSQTDSQLWKTQTMVGILTELGKPLDRTSIFQPKRV
jgi:hypothetical protein